MVRPCEKMVGDPAFRPVLGRGAGGARVFGIAIALHCTFGITLRADQVYRHATMRLRL